MFALKPSSARVTESVAVSLMRRVSDLISPFRCVSWMTSPGRIMSRLLRTSGRLRSSARSESFSCRPRNTWSSVSLRPIVTATNSKGAARASVSTGAAAAAAGRIVSSSSGLRSCAPTAVRIAPATTQEAMMPNRCGSAAAAAEAAAFAKKGRVTRGGSGKDRGRTVIHWRNQGQPVDRAAFVLRHRKGSGPARRRLPRPGAAHRIAALPRSCAGQGDRCWRLHNNSKNCAAARPNS